MTTYTSTRESVARTAVRQPRATASAELRLRIQIGEMQSILGELSEHANELLTAEGEVDLTAYRARIEELNSVHGVLSEQVERLSALLDAGADVLLLTVGSAICQTLTRILEAADAHAAAIEDGA